MHCVCMKIAGPSLALQIVHISFWLVHSDPWTLGKVLLEDSTARFQVSKMDCTEQLAPPRWKRGCAQGYKHCVLTAL